MEGSFSYSVFMQSPLIQALRDATQSGGRYLIAVSGGADSISLLHAACELAREGHLVVEAAHVNHKLREAADNDAEFVHQKCHELSIPLHISVVTEEPPNSNIEAWGRGIRYRFFRDVLDSRDLNATLTAHTANDVVETLLMRLVTNKELYTIHKRDESLRVIRPFLGVWRSDIERYISEHQLTFAEDLTNSDSKYLRNRVRHEVLPILNERFDGDVSKILWEQASRIDEDIQGLNELARASAERVRRHEQGSKDWLRVFRNALMELPDPLKWRLADQIFRPIVGFGYGRDNARRIVEFLLGDAVGLELPGKLSLRRKDGGIRITFQP